MCDVTPATSGALPYSVRAPSLAREFVRDAVCDEHGEIAQTAAMLLASELVTNAVLHGAPPVSLRVTCRVTSIELEVSDASTTEVRVSPTGESLSMLLVDKVATDWGTRRSGAGRVVWCTVPTGFLPRQGARGRWPGGAAAPRAGDDVTAEIRGAG